MAVDKLVDSTQLDEDLTSVANAIRTKGGTSAQMAFPNGFVSAVNAIPTGVTPTGTKQISITENGTVTEDVTDYADAEITVYVQGGGGETVESKDVDFIDYDGTIVASYTAQEFLALTEMPGNPVHDGLTSQGWNWSLAEAKEYVNKYGILVIGQSYVTSDGKTRVFITLDDNNYLTPYCGFYLNGTAVIDWGDGTTDTLTGSNINAYVSAQHAYQSVGDYIITIAVTGTIKIASINNVFATSLIWGNGAVGKTARTYSGIVRKIYIGNDVELGYAAFTGLYNLSEITIPTSVTTQGRATFYFCNNLKCVVLPNGMNSLVYYNFYHCVNLVHVSLPNTITSVGLSVFANVSAKKICFPDSITSMGSGVFSYALSLQEVVLPANITIVDASQFSYCEVLTRLIGLTGKTSLGTNSLMGALSLKEIEIPETITSIGINTFNGCVSLGKIKFLSATPPTVVASNAFAGLPTGCVIFVPTGSLTAYTGATNYPDPNTYSYVEF